MSDIKTAYKNIEIFYIEWQNKWDCECDYGKYKGDSLSSVKKWIDNQEKKKFQRYEVLVKSWRGISLGTVTSEKDDEVWIKYENNEREKKSKKAIIKKTNYRMELLNQLREIEKEVEIYNRNKEGEKKELINMIFAE